MGLLDFATDPKSAMLTNVALGLLSAGGPSARPISLGQAIGSAGQMGMQGYQDAQQNQMRQMQMSEYQRNALQSRLKQMQIAQFRDNLPPDQQQIFDVAPEKFIENLPQFQKPQLVETADPNEPLRSIKQWMRPGETNGTVAGYGLKPEILDPRVQDAKRDIASAGASRNTFAPTIIEGKGRTKLSELDAERISEMGKNAYQAAQAAPEIDRMLRNEGNAYSGILAPGLKGLAATADALGFATPEIKSRLVSSQLFEQGAEAYAASMLKALMGSNQLSNADVAMVRSIAPKLASTPEARLELVRYAKQRVQDIGGEYESARSWYDQNEASLTGWRTPERKSLKPVDMLKTPPTDQDLKNTAMKYGISVQEVKNRLGMK